MEQRRRQAPPNPAPIILPGAVGGVAGSVPGAAASVAAMNAGVGGEAAITTVATNSAKAVLATLAVLSRRRLAAMRERLLAAGTRPADIDRALADEVKRETVYQRLADERVKAGMKLALKASDPSARMAATEAVLRREQRFAQMRASAAAERVLASAELQELRRISPQGAFWMLGKRRSHTPDCVALAGHFFPWSVLNEVHPLLHPGCGCYLLSLGTAISQGLMAPGDIPSDATARKLAAGVIAHVRAEKAKAAKLYELEEQATRELVLREAIADANLLDADQLACAPLRCDGELAEAVADHSAGAMVALYPSPDLAKQLAVKGGVPADELHVTLAFLGKAAGLPFDKALAAVEAWAKKTPPLKGELSGIGHFDVGGGHIVTYRSVDLPELPSPREALVKALDAAGVPPSKDHGFTAHMTIDEKVRRPEVKKQPIEFTEVCLVWGEQRHSFPLHG